MSCLFKNATKMCFVLGFHIVRDGANLLSAVHQNIARPWCFLFLTDHYSIVGGLVPTQVMARERILKIIFKKIKAS